MAKAEGAEWIRFASDDLEAAEYLMGMGSRKVEIICYHCQQCAEKAMKSLYALQDREIPRIHDFRILASGLLPTFDFSRSEEHLAQLQPFAVVVRYPYEIDLIPGDEEIALSAARAILSACRAIVETSAR